MNIPGLSFLLITLSISAFFHRLPSSSWKRTVLALLNAGFLATHVPNLWTWLALGAFLGSGYSVARATAATGSRWILGGYLAILVAAFLALKKYSFLEALLPHSLLQHPVTIVGLSYVLFRQIHFIVDAMQGQIERPSLWVYLNYQLNIFTLLAGPIQRYQVFQADWQDPQLHFPDRTVLVSAYLRIFRGVLSMTVAASVCLWLYELALENAQWSRLVRTPALFYTYPAYVYFNFAGYCSVVIGTGSLLGLRIPENFNRPFLARNMIDYWNRWHITLSRWLRDYFFGPMYTAVVRRRPDRAENMAPACFFVVFLVAGIWHGSTTNFVVFGLLNGIGVSAAKLWEQYLIRRGGRPGLRSYLQSKPIEWCARACNLHFACATFLFFPAGLGQCLGVIQSMLTGAPVDATP